MKRYNPKDIEAKWQAVWEKQGVYRADLGSAKPKYIAMSMFNYPSGAGIHIGHAMNYTISDVKARFKRQQGYESYHPVGWDAFGLPAENYAIKAGVSPQQSMAKIIPDYHKQYKAMGWSNDWSKEISTHEPSYYKWTQWIFIQMLKHGLAYQDTRPQWWCDSCQTVLANEQIIDGKCWRHDEPSDPLVAKREVRQWFFKITEYADELLSAIDALDWTESVKQAQRNWIGKSQGVEIDFEVVMPDAHSSDERKEKAKHGTNGTVKYREVSTGAFDTAIAESVDQVSGFAGKRNDAAMSIRVFTTRPDTLFGATFMVLAPEHQLVERIIAKGQRTAVGEYVKAAAQKTDVERQASKEKTGVFTGAYAINPATGGEIPIWVADYVLAGYGTGAIMAVPAHDERDWEFAKKFTLPITPVFDQEGAREDGFYDGEGIMKNSGRYDGLKTSDAREMIAADLIKKGLARERVNYKIRDWSVSRQRYWGAPIPVVNCPQCGPVSVPEEDLPVLLPELQDFKPGGDGRSALARATEWLKTPCPQCGQTAERETDTLDTYLCSSWYFLRYFDPTNEDKIFDSAIINKWMPIDFYNGADHATAHMIYARFVTRFFHKLGLVDEPEPFKQFLFNGKVTASDGRMFSKSKGNSVDPLEIIDQGYGADALRVYLMFAAPLDQWVRWDPQGVPGAFRFLTRLWNLVGEYLAADEGEVDQDQASRLKRVTHAMAKKMTHDIEECRYNTAIATAMETLNELYQLKADTLSRGPAWQSALAMIVAAVAPFAPHVADELWRQLGHKTSVHIDTWPRWDDKLLTSATVTVVVQVNGKVRANVEVAAGASEEDVAAVAQADTNVARHMKNKPAKKVVYVPDKLINFVV